MVKTKKTVGHNRTIRNNGLSGKKNNLIDPVGGQALIEGVMMRSGDKIGSAYRLPDGKIITDSYKISPIIKRHKFLNIPFIRGVFVLFELLFIGTKELIKSSQYQEEEEEKIEPMEIFFTVVLSLLMGILFFKFIPLLFTKYFFSKSNSILFNIIDGIVRMIVFVIYLYAINFMSDVRRLFEYHGAEHKTVNCYEAGEKLTAENVKKYSRFHKRCGTAFILYNFIISIFVFSLVPVSLGFWKLFLYRLPLLIPIAGISYEVIKSTSEKLEFLRKPGLWLQRLTTKEPDDEQIEVAIRALKSAL